VLFRANQYLIWEQGMNKKVIPILLAFMCMGFGDAVGPFVGLAKAEFELSNFLAMIIPFMGFIMFGLLSVPMGIFQDKHSKKKTLVLGLIVALLGLSIPIFGLTHFVLFLLTVLLLGAGATILQVAGNPIMRDVSREGQYSRNLSIGQFVKAIGSLAGPVIPAVAAAWLGADWKVIFPIFVAGIIITLVSVLTTHIEESKEADKEPTTFSSSLQLLSNKYVAMMVFGIFIYVGSEVCMSSGIPLYLEDNFGVNIEKMGVLGTGLFFTTLMIGRFLGGLILNWLKPQKFFIITSITGVIGILGLFVGTASVAVVSVIIIGLSFANVFPLIFSITVDQMPEKTNELSGLMITAIVGGAIIPPIMGFVQDMTTVSLGFLVPLAAFIYITGIAFKNRKIVEKG
jgi:fucose permease